MVDERLLELLADGQFHSGQELGQTLGVSRSAVWKQMKLLETLGVEVYSIRGRGYRIPGGLDLLCEKAIVTACQPEVTSVLKRVVLTQVTPSTNVQAMQDMQQGNAAGALYITEYQTAGKGRRGRQWVSPFATNLYFSLVWRFSQGAAALEGLSLVVGLALSRAIKGLGVSTVGLKWPNDLLADGRKLAGILLEMHGDASGDCQVVIGVGVNVAMQVQHSSAIDQPWVALNDLLPQPVSRNVLMATVLNELIPVLAQFSQEGFAAFKAQWEAEHLFQNQAIRLLQGERETLGVCRGVDPHGALLVEREGSVEPFYAGEVSVRRVDAAGD